MQKKLLKTPVIVINGYISKKKKIEPCVACAHGTSDPYSGTSWAGDPGHAGHGMAHPSCAKDVPSTCKAGHAQRVAHPFATLTPHELLHLPTPSPPPTPHKKNPNPHTLLLKTRCKFLSELLVFLLF